MMNTGDHLQDRFGFALEKVYRQNRVNTAAGLGIEPSGQGGFNERGQEKCFLGVRLYPESKKLIELFGCEADFLRDFADLLDLGFRDGSDDASQAIEEFARFIVGNGALDHCAGIGSSAIRELPAKKGFESVIVDRPVLGFEEPRGSRGENRKLPGQSEKKIGDLVAGKSVGRTRRLE